MKELIKLTSKKRFVPTNRKEIYDVFCMRLETAIKGEIVMSSIEEDYAHNVDSFQYHYLLYLCCFHKTRFSLNERFRNLINDPLFKLDDLALFLREIELFLLKKEMYEALSVFVKTNSKFTAHWISLSNLTKNKRIAQAQEELIEL